MKVQVQVYFIHTHSKVHEYNNTIIVVCYIEYYRRRVDIGRKSRAFELTTTTVQLLMGGSFICKTNYKAHTIDNHKWERVYNNTSD